MMVDHSSVSHARFRLASRQTTPPSPVGPTLPVISLVATSGSGGVPGSFGVPGSGLLGPPGSPGVGSGSALTGSELPPPPQAASPTTIAATTARWVAFFLIGFTLLFETAEVATARFSGGFPRTTGQ